MAPRARVRLIALVVVAAAAMPAEASGHAVLTHSTPHRGDAVPTAPPAVRFDFNEPVEVSTGGLRLYDAHGERVDEGAIARPGGSAKSVTVEVPDRLADGVYTATYHVTSADGHPVAGGFAFTVGTPPKTARTAPTVASLLDRNEAGSVVEAIYGVARGLHYAALLIVIGAIGMLVAAWPRAGMVPRWPRGLLLAVGATGLVSSLVALPMQGALGAAVGVGHALDQPVLDGALESRAGAVWLVRAALWIIVIAVVATATGRRARPALLGLAAAAIVVSLPLAGHADTLSPGAVLLPADLLHVLAAGVWLGGLVLLLALYWPRRGRPAADDGLAATIAFSRVALPAIVVLVAAGSVQTWFYLDGIEMFIEGTYGVALLAKIGLLCAIVVLAAANRRRLRRRVDLRAAMRAEVVLAVLVLAATAVIVRAEPPATLAEGPSISELDLGPMRVELWIEPARSGPNDIHVYLFDRRTGAQVDRVEEITLRLTKPDERIPAIRLEIPRKNAAHYELLRAPIGITGTWKARLTVRVSEFDEYSAAADVSIRRRE